MGTTLRISILLNCTLLGCLAFLLLTGRRGPLPVEVSATADNPSPVTEVAIRVPLAAPTAEARPFYWRQIESADYRIYIANLRAIGCPEQTIRDIITADVDSLCAARR